MARWWAGSSLASLWRPHSSSSLSVTVSQEITQTVCLSATCVTISFIIPHVNFQQSDWSIGRVTILNVTRQCLKAVKFVVEIGHSV